MELRQAKRKNAKMKLALQGSAGSGKTYSALLLASGIAAWEKVSLIDTEHGSGELYAHLGDYNVLQLDKPFTPERYIKAIEICEDAGMDVIIIDSISHEWDGAGGILSIHSNMTGQNSFANWNKVTPRHNAFVQKILESQCHIIGTIRTKTDYTLNERNGKVVPEKVGLKGITRDGMDYEFTIQFEIDVNHNAVATKDRTGIFSARVEEVITAEHGKQLLQWCNEGISIDEVKHQIQNAKTVEELRNILKTYPEFRKEIEVLAINRKEVLQNIINEPKISGNGISESK
ncbi:AAA family ATPase [Draconibacterium orientale]|uniref:AAA family ATPase n=1 Tax=Draconibacterium orientale TaxID=1168034 RepID=UPI002A0A8844|nr:AAA family ATPase [Draconibacterium orientale]